MSSQETKGTILDAAEALFAEQGYAATSLRQMTTLAGVNLAAVHYHFGCKEDLARAVLSRRIAPINQERLRRLDAIPARRRTLAAIVRAFVEPPLRSSAAVGDDHGGTPGTRLCRVFGRVSDLARLRRGVRDADQPGAGADVVPGARGPAPRRGGQLAGSASPVPLRPAAGVAKADTDTGTTH